MKIYKPILQEKENQILKLQKEVEKWKKAVKTQRYGLVWLDVPEAFEDDVENKLPILEEVPKNAIKSKDDKPTHLLIEGDNYHALTCLNYTHKGKVDVIYIDPPYNTGSDGFKYKDKRILEQYPDGTEVPKDHPFRHSYWLSFMRKRLELAKDILKDEGVIFMSIDVNELAQLKLLADEVFGESNLVSLISIKVKDPAGVGQQSFVFDVSEYVLMYAKNINVFKNTHQELPVDYEPLTEQYGSYTKTILDFGKPKFVKEIDRQNVGQVKIYKCDGYSVKKTTDFTLKEYVKNRNKVFADYNPNGGMIYHALDYHI
jgi:adenine specific DNA methylase Mod